MKKFAIVLVALVMVVSFVSAVYSADGFPNRGAVKLQTLSPTTCTHVTTSPAYIYGITIKAKQAAAWAALADSNTTGASSAATHWTAMQTYDNLKVVVQEATQYDTYTVMYDPPIYCENGIFYIEGYSGTLESGNGGDGTDTIIYYTGV